MTKSCYGMGGNGTESFDDREPVMRYGATDSAAVAPYLITFVVSGSPLVGQARRL